MIAAMEAEIRKLREYFGRESQAMRMQVNRLFSALWTQWLRRACMKCSKFCMLRMHGLVAATAGVVDLHFATLCPSHAAFNEVYVAVDIIGM